MYKYACKIAHAHKHNSDQDHLLSSYFPGNYSDRYEADDCRDHADKQTVREAAAFHFPDNLCVPRKRCRYRVIRKIP